MQKDMGALEPATGGEPYTRLQRGAQPAGEERRRANLVEQDGST